MKYILESPIVGRIGQQKFKTSIIWRNGAFITDEPEKIGGQDLGPDPYSLLLSSLVACTLATLRLYIDHKTLEIKDITVEANMYQKIVKEQIVTYIDRSITFDEAVAPEIKQRLLKIAESCPVSKILKGNVEIATQLPS